MATKRLKPYVWAAWVARILAGESQCTWAVWFRAYHRYERIDARPREAQVDLF